MQKQISLILCLALLICWPLRAGTGPLVVVSSRQYLVQGDSTIHLYLYGFDGKLLKQLTNDPGQDDHAPMFSHDGKSVLFSRVTTGTGAPNQSGKYILHLADGTLTRLPDGTATDPAPPDYNPTIATNGFDNLAFMGSSPGDADPADGPEAASFTASDKSAQLVKMGSDDNPIFKLKTANSPRAKPLSDFPGYEKLSDDYLQDGYLADKEGPFLLGPAHYGALFVSRHRDSMWAFDLHRKIWHKIQSEWVPGDIYAVQNKAGFYFIRCSMEPLGNTGKTVMSAYLEWWNADFQRVILSPPLSVTYGAAIYYGDGETSCILDEIRGS